MSAKPDDGIGKADGNGGGTRAREDLGAMLPARVDRAQLELEQGKTKAWAEAELMRWLVDERYLEGAVAEEVMGRMLRLEHRRSPGGKR